MALTDNNTNRYMGAGADNTVGRKCL